MSAHRQKKKKTSSRNLLNQNIFKFIFSNKGSFLFLFDNYVYYVYNDNIIHCDMAIKFKYCFT